MPERKFGLSRTTLKYIAIIAMTVDHIGWAFVKTPTLLGQSMHIVGRLTIVIMSLFAAEGYIHTKNFNRYLGRMLIFAFISQPFYVFFHSPTLKGLTVADILDLNVLFSLSLALIALKVFEEKIPTAFKAILILALCMLSYNCDWCFFPILFALLFFVTKDDKKKRIIAFLLLAFAVFAFYNIRFALRYDKSIYFALRYDGMMAGLILGAVPVYLYNGEKGTDSKFSKWLFYVYYPLHLFVLGLIKLI